jgi:hypothetical protein
MISREHIESALRGLTDGSLTFRVDEDEHSIAAAFTLDGRLTTHAWPKYHFQDHDDAYCRRLAEDGVRLLLAKGNGRRSDLEPESCRGNAARHIPRLLGRRPDSPRRAIRHA